MIRQDLLSWYKKNHRKLPWRATRDPYYIWISEVMLQQTKVDTVIPYYEKFIAAFPTVEALAASSEQSVLKAWEGLGYYRRAKHLHAAAKELAANYGGALPKTREALSQLKGFGPYTSASVASIAFDQPVACVDGNVRRVVSRLFATNESIEQLAQQLLEPSDPSSFNQAMMELGALICVPKSPKCIACPLQKHCKSHQTNQTDVFPAIKTKAKPKEVFAFVFIPRLRDLYFVEQRSENQRWANMWQFPMLEYESCVPLASAMKDFEKTYGLRPEKQSKQKAFKHLLTHRTMHVQPIELELAKKSARIDGKGEWIGLDQFHQKPFSRLSHKILVKLGA